MRTAHKALLLASATLCWCSAPLAQNKPAAPAATTSAAGKVSTLGQGQPKGKTMTREELRSCLDEQTELAKRRPQVERGQAELQRERQELQQLEEALKNERAAIDKATQAVIAINDRTKDLSAKVADWNERYAKFQQDNRSGPAAERQRTELEREQKALQASAQTLEVDRAAVTPVTDQTLKTYNARAATQSQAATDWNARSAQVSKTAQAYETDRENWTADCAGRPYREDDEIAIKAGK